MERRLSFSLQNGDSPYFDLFKIETGGDGSLYASLPELFASTGAHYSFHPTGIYHFRMHNPSISSLDFATDRLLRDIEQKNNHFLMKLDLSKIGPGTLAIFKMKKLMQSIMLNKDLYKSIGKRIVVSSPEFKKIIKRMPIYNYENLRFEMRRLFAKGVISRYDIVIASPSDSSIACVVVPAFGLDCGTILDFNSKSSLNKLPGFEALQEPLNQVFQSSALHKLPSVELPFF